MFVMNKYVEEAWTPELGGDFETLRLKIKMLTPQEYQDRIAANAIQTKTPDGKPTLEFDLIQATKNIVASALDRVVGWEGTDTPFSEQVRDKALAQMINDKTGITLAGKDEPETLRDYILHFAGDRTNFLAVSKST